MTTVQITDHDVTVELTRAEKLGALHGDVRIPRSQIRSVEPITDAIAAPRGLRSPGLAVPGLVKLGVWRSRHGRQFVAVRKGIPGVRLTLEGHRFAEVVLSVADESVRNQLLAATPVS